MENEQIPESVLRDLFAITALHAIIVNGNYAALAKDSYRIADEMLAARKEKK